MKKAFLVLLALAGCSHPKPAIPPAKPDIAPCAAATPQPVAPKPPRTLESIVDAYNQSKLAGAKTEAALRDCSAKVDLLTR